MTYVSAGCEGQGDDGCLGVPLPPADARPRSASPEGREGSNLLGSSIGKHSSVRFGRPPSYWAGEGKRLQEPAHLAKTIILDDLERSAKIPGAGWQSGIGCIEAQCLS
jgi:hypothetical protein